MYLVFYVAGCEPKVRKFKSEKSMNKFLSDFLFISQENEDYWVDHVVKGELLRSYCGTEIIDE